MDKDIQKGIKIAIGFFFTLTILFGIVFAVGFHSASEIVAGVFQGDYTFNGSIIINDNATFNGDVNFTGTVIGVDSVPQNAVLSFNDSSCPTGWSVYSSSTFTSDLVPTLSSNTHVDGNATGSSGTIYVAFNEVYTGYGNSWDGGPPPSWIGFNFTTPQTIGQYTIRARNTDSNDASYSPNTWNFQGYNGTSWVTIESQSGQTFSSGQQRIYNSFTNTNSYNAYRVYITANNGGYGSLIGEMEMMGISTVTCSKD